MEAAIRSPQVGTSQQSAQQPQSELSGARGTTAGPPPHPHSMSYSQPRTSVSGGINEVHRSSATNSSPYQISPHSIPPHSYVERSRVRPANSFTGASIPGKSYNWQPQTTQHYEYGARTTLHQPTIVSAPSFVNASFAAGFPPRVSIPTQPPTQSQQQQNVPGAPRPISVNEYIDSSIRNAAAAGLLQPSQPNQRPQTQPPPDPGGNSAPAYKKIRLNEPPYQSQQTNSIGHHPGAATAPTTIPVRLHHSNYDKAGPIQPNNQVVVHVASTPRSHQNPVVGATAEIQYQPQKPPQQPTHQISTAASPQQQQQQAAATQQAQQSQQPPANNSTANTKVLSVLKIDTRDAPTTSTTGTNAGGYHPKTEAISPAGSPKLSKDDLLQQISSVDSSMMSLEERKRILKEKERHLIEQKEEGVSPDVPEVPTPHRTLAQQIYAENKKKANDSHAILNALNYKGQIYELPLYNQPSDADVCRKIHEHYLTFRSTLLLHLRKIKSERAQRNHELADKYTKLSADWQKRVEKLEASIKRKNRELKNRELFEKVFVELRKQREDKERFNRVGSRVKSEADFEVIVDGLQEQAQEDKKMRSYAVIPPIMFDNRQRRLVFHNENGSNVDMEAELSAYKTLNLWTSGEKETFRDKYIQQAKNFGFIASHLERKQPQDCVLYYYLSKKDVKYKQLLRKSSKRTRSTKNLPKTSESQSLLDLMTTGVTTRLQRKCRTGRSTTTSAAASVSESQTLTRSSAPLPTVTVTVNSNLQNQEMVKEEIDPLCIRSMSENASSSPAPTGTTRRASSNGNQSVETSFLSTKIKTDPDGDVVMKTESDSNSNSWPTYPPNGLKHEAIKAEDIKVESGKSSDDATIKKEESNQKDEKKVEIKKEPDEKESTADEAKGKKPNAMDVDDENWSNYEPSSAKKRKIEESGANDMDKTLYPCYVCKQENCSRTRLLEKGKTQQFGIGNEENIPANARVCINCQNKTAKSRFSTSTCPLPTCQNPKDRLKRVRNIPAEFFEMSPEQRDPIIKELQIPPNVTKCCSACLTRIKRQMGTRLSLSDEEIQQFRKQLQEIGPKWSQLGEQLNKSATVLKTFYFHNKKKYGFDQAVNEYYKTHVSESPRPITDGDESDVSVTSSDDNGSEHKSTHSGVDGEKVEVKSESIMVTSTITATPVTSISNVSMQIPASKEIISIKSELQTPQIDDRLPPPLGQPPPLLSSQQIQNLSVSGMPRGPDTHPLVSVMMRTKKHSEEYDSSATETADEENESSPANRQSPKNSSVFAGKNLNPATTISMVPQLPTSQNGPLSSVHDVMLNVIERSLKSQSAPPKHSVPPLKPNPPPTQASQIDNNPEVTFVGTYRHDPNKIQMQAQRRGNSDQLQTLATLSIVNSHGGPNSGPNSQILGGHPLNISSIAATITPVPPPQMNQPRSTLPPQHMSQAQEKEMKFGIRQSLQQPQQQSEPEPQTLDLSIKKPAQQQQQQQPERSFPSFQAKAPPPPTGGSIYRGDPNIPSQSTYLAFHPDVNRPSKSPHIPPPLSPNQRVLSLPPHAVQQSQQGMQNKNKVTQKLSPKVHHQIPVSQSQGTQQMNGPKGSITLGTPLNDRGQPIMIQGGPPGRGYDILRQTPPSGDKFGSITAGTPIHLSDKRVHEYMKNSRHSPATSQPNVSSAQSGSPHPSMAGAYRPPNDLSSTRDLIFSDYMISQQMQGQSRGPPNMPNTINIISAASGNVQQGRPEKESPSPRNIAHSNSPASMYYHNEKERERVGGQTRTEYLSRSSPADHHNSTPSPHRTPPPPQRQGVIIQRHNASSSKPPSPAPSRLPPQGQFTHHYSHGHDALSHLVDVAVAQQALPVPNDNNRRPSHIPVTSSESQSHQSLPPPRDRFPPYLLPADVVAIQHQHQQQVQMELLRRHQEYERKEREMHHERERDRERDERDAQRRVDAELAQRNYDRDRLEQMRIAYPPRNPYTGQRLPEDSNAQMISAQCLINAIITENIRPSEPRERYQINRDHLARLQQQSENNGNSHSPNIINVDVDSSTDLPRHPSAGSLPSKPLKLNDLTDAIIAKDPSFGMHHQQGPGGPYHLPPGHFVRTGGGISSKTPPNQNQQMPGVLQPMGQEQIIATDQWKLNRRLQQQQQQKEEMAKSGNPQGRSTPDDRHIIRMQQSPSPRSKMPPYEPVSPPDAGVHYHPKISISYDQRKGMQVGPEQQPADGTKLLTMLNHRIAEVMRNDDKYPNDHQDGKERRESDQMKGYERPRSGNSAGPGNGVDGDKSPVGKRESPHVYIHTSRPSSQPGNPPYPPPSSMPYMYAYNPLTMPQVGPPAGPNPIISPKPASDLIDSNRQQQNMETSRQVMSDNYDALSDDDN